MTDEPDPLDTLIASRLDHLLRTVHPAGRKPYSPGEVAAAINAAAGENMISGQYIWQLRTGQRDNPTYKHLIALSRFFGVPPTYFFPDSETERGAVPAEVALALQDDALRDMALRAAGLSERSLKAISDMVDSARAMETPPPRTAARSGSPAKQRETEPRD
jgi:transcriptional regulator with XRE-family HTH domain